MQQPKALPDDIRKDHGNTGDIAARTVEARDKAELDGVSSRTKHDWDGRRRGFGHGRRACRIHDDDRDLAANQIGGKRRTALWMKFVPATLNRDVATLDKSGLRQPLKKRKSQIRLLRRPGVEKPNGRQGTLLRACRAGPKAGRGGSSRCPADPRK